MRVAFVQFAPAFGAVAANVRRALALAEGVAAQLYVFPELFASGYQFLSREELASYAEAPADGYTFAALRRWCAHKGVFACAGLPAREGDAIYNAAALVGPDGLVAVYPKAHLFGREKGLFDAPAADPFRVFDLGVARVGVMICFDWIFPEAARILALRGAQVILHPANLVLPYCPAAMVTRCLENGVFAVTAGRVGAEDRLGDGRPLAFIGASRIIGPRGDVLAAAGDEEAAVAVEIDPSRADDKHVTPQNDLLADRRVALYRRLLEP